MANNYHAGLCGWRSVIRHKTAYVGSEYVSVLTAEIRAKTSSGVSCRKYFCVCVFCVVAISELPRCMNGNVGKKIATYNPTVIEFVLMCFSAFTCAACNSKTPHIFRFTDIRTRFGVNLKCALTNSSEILN